MGGSSWSSDTYASRSVDRAHLHTDSVFKANTDKKINPLLNPHGVKFRESRDSAAHPESNAIIVFFDVTGSMGEIPELFARKKLGGLMKMLIDEKAIDHPQILFGGIGDARYPDEAPLQVGQFESGLEIDDDLTRMWLEKGGGGTAEESYGLGLYWAAHHTAIDCLEKRGKKGYIFMIGDERYYPKLTRAEIKKVIGDDVQDDLPIEAVIEQVKERYELIHICVRSRTYSHGHLEDVQKLLGQSAVFMPNPELVCELIAAQIAAFEGHDDHAIKTGLAAAGLAAGAADTVTKALVRNPGGGAVAKGSVTGDLAPASGGGGSTRL